MDSAYLERIIRIIRRHWVQCLPITSRLTFPGVQINCAGNIKLVSMANKDQFVSGTVADGQTGDCRKLTCELCTLARPARAQHQLYHP